MRPPPFHPRHFLHRMKGTDRLLGGDTASWFRFYKWEVEGEVFVPRQNGEHLPAQPGDLVWFCLDEQCLGCVEVLQVVLDPMGSGVQEVWYEPSRAWVPRDKLTLSATASTISTDEVPSETASQWLRDCLRRSVEEAGTP
jgi:hypothetical protein